MFGVYPLSVTEAVLWRMETSMPSPRTKQLMLHNGPRSHRKILGAPLGWGAPLTINPIIHLKKVGVFIGYIYIYPFIGLQQGTIGFFTSPPARFAQSHPSHSLRVAFGREKLQQKIVQERLVYISDAAYGCLWPILRQTHSNKVWFFLAPFVTQMVALFHCTMYNRIYPASPSMHPGFDYDATCFCHIEGACFSLHVTVRPSIFEKFCMLECSPVWYFWLYRETLELGKLCSY